MIHQPDWNNAKKRFSALWANELVDRCCIGITCPLAHSNVSSVKQPVHREGSLENWWTDPEEIYQRNLLSFRETCYFGEAHPCVFLNFGPAGNAAYYGATPIFAENTIWHSPWIKDCEDYGRLSFLDPQEMFSRTIKVAKYLCDKSRGEFHVSMPDNCVALDVLAQLRDTEELLCDMILYPEEVKRALLFLVTEWKRLTSVFYDLTKDNNQGAGIGWLHTHAPGLHAQIQCDIAAMMSPQHFDSFFMPELEEACSYLAYSLYHLDGIEQIRHLDSILSCDSLNMIQWTSVAGQPPAIAYIDILKRIQAKGKGLLLNVAPEYVEALLAELSSKGLYIVTYAPDEESARFLLRRAEQLTHE
jgi:hypothetical protein